MAVGYLELTIIAEEPFCILIAGELSFTVQYHYTFQCSIMYPADFIKHIHLINLVVKIANHMIKYYTVCSARNKWMCLLKKPIPHCLFPLYSVLLSR
jgi:hypothetical protein